MSGFGGLGQGVMPKAYSAGVPIVQCPFCGAVHAAKDVAGERTDDVWDWEFVCCTCGYKWETP